MILHVMVIPNASRNEIVGWHDGALKIRLAAPPVEGRANQELLRVLAKTLGLAPSNLSLAQGQTGKRKKIVIPLAEEDVRVIVTSQLQALPGE